MIYIIGHKNPDLDSVAAAISLAELKKKTEKGEFTAARAGEPTAEASYILKKFNIEPPILLEANEIKSGDKIILVDHNEENQRMDALDPTQIIEIIDHHYRIDLDLNQPIEILVRPWGASAAIIFTRAQEKGIELSLKTAKLLLAAILSDTLGLRSPTTTDHDREAVKKLSSITKIKDVEALALEIIKAKSDISGLSPKQIVTNDHKVYDFSGKKVLIGQVETVEQEELVKKKEKFLAAMVEIKREKGLDFIFLALTDPLKKNTKMLCAGEGERAVLEKAFSAKGEDGPSDIGPRLSRKKEMVPEIERVVGK